MKTRVHLRHWRILAIGLGLAVGTAQGQIATDGTVGSAQSLTGPNYAIGAGLGTQRGANLFHSFSTFNINTGESATFTGPNGLQNVISRVTGGTLSSIDGTLRSEINGANVWFINPAGVVFGANAKLDVPAAFHVSTADELRFADGAVFSAANPGVSTLSTEPVEAFGFLGPHRGRIGVEGSQLQFAPGSRVTISAGDIAFQQATLFITGGQLALTAMGETTGSVSVDRPSPAMAEGSLILDNAILGLDGDGGGGAWIRAGELTLTNDSNIQAINTGSQYATHGIDIAVATLTVRDSIISTSINGTGQGGNLQVNARDNIQLIGGALTSIALLNASGQAGDIQLSAPNILVDGTGFYPGILSTTGASGMGAGQGGNIRITATNALELRHRGRVSASTYAAGQAGNITVTANHLSMDGQQGDYLTGIFSETVASLPGDPVVTGSAGNIHLAIADTLTVLNGGKISTETDTAGDAGSITITVGNLLLEGYKILGEIDGQPIPTFSSITSGVTQRSTGHGGNVDLEVNDRLKLDQGGQISADTAGPQDAGSITVTVANAAAILNGGQISASTWNNGNAGDIAISTDELRVDNQNSPYFTGIKNSTAGAGNAGNLTLTLADDLTVMNSGQISSATWGTGNGGSIVITTAGRIDLAGGLQATDRFYPSGLFVSSFGTGQAGDVTVTAPALTISDSASIKATSDLTTGGNLLINAADLRLFNRGQISTSVFGDPATTGGDVEINSRTVVALDGSTVTAKAKQGKGGNILVNTDVFLHDAPSIDDVLNASSESTVTGNQGSVTVNTALDPGRSIVGITRRLGDLNDANPDPCARRKGIKKSTLTQVGRGGLPADNRPEGMTTSLSGGDWTPPAEPVEPAPSMQEPLALNADRDDCRL